MKTLCRRRLSFSKGWRCNISSCVSCVCVSRSVGAAAAAQSDRCPVCPWTVPSSINCPVSTGSSPRPPTYDSCWSSSDWFVKPGAPH